TDKYIFLRPRVVTTQYNNYVNNAYNKGQNSLVLYLDGDKVEQYTFSELAPKSPLVPFGVSESELRSERIYDAYIQPNKGTLTFDAVTIGYSPVYKSDITVIFPEPITKTDKDVFNLKLSYTVTGGRDSLDLSNIIPLLDWQSLTHSL